MIRDGILASCGLLVEQVGGPPVNTYDLAESFKPATPGSGPDLHRRSLYTLWRRTGPGPVLESFDVPKRAVCVARRDTTNTPLHALVLLNGPQFVEASRVLAQKLLSGKPPGAGDVASLLTEGFERLTSRRPDEAELGILRTMPRRNNSLGTRPIPTTRTSSSPSAACRLIRRSLPSTSRAWPQSSMPSSTTTPPW